MLHARLSSGGSLPVPFRTHTSKLGASTANGQELRHYGQRNVQLTIGNAIVDAVLQVLDVSRALLSVSQMTENGWKMNFDGQRAQECTGELQLHFRKIDGMFGVKCKDKLDKETAQWALALDSEVANAGLPEEVGDGMAAGAVGPAEPERAEEVDMDGADRDFLPHEQQFGPRHSKTLSGAQNQRVVSRNRQ